MRGSPVGGGMRSRWRSKSPTTPWTRRPGYSSTSASAALAHDATRRRRTGRSAQPARAAIASSSTRVFGADARAQLDQLASRPVAATISAACALEDRALGARRVVLGQLADAVEQLRAARVVEVLGRQLLERPRQPVEHVVGEAALVRLVEAALDRDVGIGDRGHRLTRPSRSAGRRRSGAAAGRSQLRNVGVATRGRVAHEPPRSTR